MGTPFEDEFDIDGEGAPEFDIEVDDINASELTKLSEIKMYAMMGFKMTMSQISMVSPDKIIKMHEIAQKYLAEAKDAEFKAEKLKIDLKRANNVGNMKPSPNAPKPGEASGDNTGSGLTSRNSLYDLPDTDMPKLPN